MKFSELTNQAVPELQERLKQARLQLGQLRFSLSNKALKDFSQLGKVRKECARLLTAIQQKLKP